MNKKRIPGMSNKDILQAKAKDKMHRFLLADGSIRGAIVHGTHIVGEMAVNHETDVLETMILGHAYLGCLLITANLKGNDQVHVKIECGGPVKGLSAEANAHGEVRGHLKNGHIELEKPFDGKDFSSLFGNGFMQVTRFPEFAKSPYVGQVVLEYGSIAKDLANYYLTSEQIPTVFNLSVKFDNDGNVSGAGGLFLQVLPDAEPEIMDRVEPLIHQLPSIGEAFEQGVEPQVFVDKHLSELKPNFLASQRVEFFCRCREETITRMLSKMDKATQKDILKNGPFPLETRCHNCNTYYSFDRERLTEIFK